VTEAPARAAPGRLSLAAIWRLRWLLGVAAWLIAAALLYSSRLGAELNPYLTLTGLAVGFLVGLTGMGGGALMTPVLILVFGFHPTLAVGTDIAYAALTKVFGSWRHLTQGSVDKGVALWLAAGSVPSGLLGAFAVNALKRHEDAAVDVVLYRAIGAALVVVGALLLLRLLLRSATRYSEADLDMSTGRRAATVAIGATTGFVIGLTSVGSGTLLALFLILFYPLAARRIVGTDVFHATILLGATAIAQLRFGNVDLAMVGALLVGSVPGVVIGSNLTVRTPVTLLRGCLAVVLALSGIALLGKG
jgi:uncharacterized membrane protein YfcA